MTTQQSTLSNKSLREVTEIASFVSWNSVN